MLADAPISRVLPCSKADRANLKCLLPIDWLVMHKDEAFSHFSFGKVPLNLLVAVSHVFEIKPVHCSMIASTILALAGPGLGERLATDEGPYRLAARFVSDKKFVLQKD
ncbi:hypothetical protein PoB_006367000 [Plakobranchus ocellatus]|uniref:Uncharacterized protein n=1 Tax=Plakobranchus ocellatus TaxID=259542 RepID=A0AAV4CZ58_9GAST|nr:hypothetical protein PoB_006367000 [Plakobranchus ocellatus]